MYPAKSLTKVARFTALAKKPPKGAIKLANKAKPTPTICARDVLPPSDSAKYLSAAHTIGTDDDPFAAVNSGKLHRTEVEPPKAFAAKYAYMIVSTNAPTNPSQVFEGDNAKNCRFTNFLPHAIPQK